MISSVKLTKQLVNGKNLIISPTYVSNGHWLVRKSIFKNSFVLSDPLETLGVVHIEKDDGYLERVIEKAILEENLTRIDKTQWIQERKVYNKKSPMHFQLFVTEDDVGVLFNKKYIDAFGIETLWAPIEKDESGFPRMLLAPSIDAPTWNEANIAIMHVVNEEGDNIMNKIKGKGKNG